MQSTPTHPSMSAGSGQPNAQIFAPSVFAQSTPAFRAQSTFSPLGQQPPISTFCAQQAISPFGTLASSPFGAQQASFPIGVQGIFPLGAQQPLSNLGAEAFARLGAQPISPFYWPALHYALAQPVHNDARNLSLNGSHLTSHNLSLQNQSSLSTSFTPDWSQGFYRQK